MSNQIWDWFPFPPIFAFTSIKKCRKFVRNKFGKRFERKGVNGTCWVYHHPDCGEISCVVYLNCKDERPSRKYAILAHECCHVADAFFENIKEEEIGEETYAYTVQAAMLACIEQIGEEWFTETPQTSNSSSE